MPIFMLHAPASCFLIPQARVIVTDTGSPTFYGMGFESIQIAVVYSTTIKPSLQLDIQMFLYNPFIPVSILPTLDTNFSCPSLPKHFLNAILLACFFLAFQFALVFHVTYTILKNQSQRLISVRICGIGTLELVLLLITVIFSNFTHFSDIFIICSFFTEKEFSIFYMYHISLPFIARQASRLHPFFFTFQGSNGPGCAGTLNTGFLYILII